MQPKFSDDKAAPKQQHSGATSYPEPISTSAHRQLRDHAVRLDFIRRTPYRMNLIYVPKHAACQDGIGLLVLRSLWSCGCDEFGT
jgi:hypothetical protein